jgi:hypothetical protein
MNLRNLQEDTGPDFWIFHGYILTILWFAAATIAVFFRKKSTDIHKYIFIFIDIGTLVLTIIALVKAFGDSDESIPFS